MFLFRRLRNRICKKYGEDLFGDLLLNGLGKKRLVSKLIPRRPMREKWMRAMRVDIVDPRKRERPINAYYYMYRMKHKMRIYYGTMREQQFKKVLGSVFNIKGFFANNAFSILESRIDSILYRSNFVKTLPLGRQLILHGYVYINGHVVTKYSYCLRPGDILALRRDYQRKFFSMLKIKIKKGGFLCYHPTYLETNYKLLTIMLIGHFHINDLYYPFEFGIFIVFGNA